MLTAAHCFARAGTDKVSQQVDIKHGQCQYGKIFCILSCKRKIARMGKKGKWGGEKLQVFRPKFLLEERQGIN